LKDSIITFAKLKKSSMINEQSIFGINYKEIHHWIINAGTNLLIAVLILIVGFWLAGIMSKLVKKAMQKSNVDPGLVSFIGSFISLGSKIMVVITAITQIGIQMTSFITVLGAAGLAVGMAFSGTLSNFAGGIMILVLKPFKVGDTINALGQQGTVKEIQIFNTYLNSVDNKVIILPNGPVANGSIINLTREEKRRLDFMFPLSYGSDVNKAFDLIEKILHEDERVLKDPMFTVAINEMNDTGLVVVVRVWVDHSDYGVVQLKLNKAIYLAFESAGIQFKND
jgi:small conductance mechanosensitive channel